MTRNLEESRKAESGLAPEELDLIARISGWIVERRMSVPAILFLESHRPLSFIGSQVMIAASPVVSTFEPFVRGLLGRGFSYEEYRRFAELMENRDNVEELIVTIERQHQSHRDREREEKRQRKATRREARRKKKELRSAAREGLHRGDS